MAENKIDFEKREEQVRSVLLRILIGLFIAIASLLFCLTIPFYPTSFAVVLALVLGGLAYRAPALSLGLMFLLNIPGYVYQGGFHIAIVVVVGLIFLAVTIWCIGRQGACLVIAAGVIAATLMFTPVYFLSIPLLVSVILFRARGVATGSPAAILVFLAIYNPFLVSNLHVTAPTDVVPLFQVVEFTPKEPVFTIEVGHMISQLRTAAGSNVDVYKYLTIYWPLISVGRVLGVVLYFIIAFSLYGAFGTLSALRWLGSRDIGSRYLTWIAPTLSLLIADAAFLLPLSSLATSFRYTTGLDASHTTFLVLATVGIGGAGSAIEFWLKTRDVSLELRQNLNLLIPTIKGKRGDLQGKLISIRTLAPRIDLNSEDQLLAVCDQELGYVEGRVGVIPAEDLQEKIKFFTEAQQGLQKGGGEVERKLLQFYDESKERYDTAIARVRELGLGGVDVLQGLTMAELTPLGFERIMAELAKLNEAFDKLGQYLIAGAKESSLLISGEVDREFKLFGLEIAQNYLDTHHSQDAVDSVLAAFVSMREILDKAASDVSPGLAALARTWETIIEKEAIPTIKMVGDRKLLNSLLGLEPSIAGLTASGKEKRAFAELVQLVRIIKELNDAISFVNAQLLEKISEQVKVIESKVPSGFEWGKNEMVLHKLSEARQRAPKEPKQPSLGASLMNVELALKSIGEAASLIQQYIFENEFLINYSSMESLINFDLEKQATVSVKELPVKEKYASRYLGLYARHHYDRVSFDGGLGILRTVEPT